MKTTKQMELEIQEVFPFIEILDEYTGANNKVTLKCNDCGHIWKAVPRSVKSSKYGCSNCKTSKSKIEKSKKLFLERLDKTKFELIEFNNRVDVKVKCLKCGNIRHTTSSNILRFGCKSCSSKKANDINRLTKEEFIRRAKEIHGDTYNYDKVEYINWTTSVIITCPKHGDFAQMPGKHLSGHGCQKCAGRNWTKEDFIKEANIIHNNKYDYSLVSEKFHLTDKITIICPKHGEFIQLAQSHIGQKCGCPKCKASHGELEIIKVLDKLKIKYYSQFKIKNPYNSTSFIVDFLFKINNIAFIIEFNGEQHYRPIDFFGGEERFKQQILRDEHLRKFCKEKQIQLLEIPFNEIQNVKNLIVEFLRCRPKEQSIGLLTDNIGEPCDGNTEINSETKKSESSLSIEIEPDLLE